LKPKNTLFGGGRKIPQFSVINLLYVWADLGYYQVASVVQLEVYKISVNNRFVLVGGAENLKYSVFDSTFEALFSDTVMMRGFPKICKLITDFSPIPIRVTLKSTGNPVCTVIQYNPFYAMFTEQWKGGRGRGRGESDFSIMKMFQY